MKRWISSHGACPRAHLPPD